MGENIPSQLQCVYCKRNHTHGGECHKPKNDIKGCLIFLPDERGCIRSKDTRLTFPIFHKIPPLRTWDSDWEIGGIDTKIRINRIHGFDWDVPKGKLIVYCNIDYFINEYHPEFKHPTSKPTLTLIK
ncbi:hypothetical protein BHU72_11905 [Desulfuribacillus stibiiarsenatis]|uniref:Uncharacterized protein n=1 Tax=Desulfuribacillus stibiiarsenatis TaxID=1390249 RepID=A0A1E5L8G1_9FIRM|nr:hypothetical protein [Desulfuribacillus stibiiarsenatis]OEH86233.1 hypothetical protein BHU72_11905 [Desulfuribacillus stibiiarsenatis]